jgi:hypothetical protein
VVDQGDAEAGADEAAGAVEAVDALDPLDDSELLVELEPPDSLEPLGVDAPLEPPVEAAEAAPPAARESVL